jgi:hypothetical protein
MIVKKDTFFFKFVTTFNCRVAVVSLPPHRIIHHNSSQNFFLQVSYNNKCTRLKKQSSHLGNKCVNGSDSEGHIHNST